MSEKELNNYRFLSGEEPTDEMLAAIMKEAKEEALAKRKIADDKMQELMQLRRAELKAKYSERISNISGVR